MTVSRRTIATGAAWAVPVILVGAPAPAAAASSPVSVHFDGVGCKEPGKSQNVDWGYRITLRVNSLTTTVVIFGAVSAPGDPNAQIVGNSSFAVSAGTQEITVTLGASNSANGIATLFYTANGVQGSVQVVIDGFNPCKK